MPTKERLRELIREARAGRLPPPIPSINLPRNKAEEPKLLALDCNQWVALARAHYGRSNDVGVSQALDAIRALVLQNRLIVPLHFINALEARQREDPASRDRLVRFMVELSGNWVFRPSPEIAEAETRTAVLHFHPQADRPEAEIRQQLVAYGVPGLFGAPTDRMEAAAAELERIGVREAFDRWHHSPEATIEALVEGLRGGSTVADGRSLEEKGARRMQASRDADAALPRRDRIRLELANQWDGRPGERVRQALRELSLDVDSFRRWLDGNLERFWALIASVHVPLMLEIESAKNRSRPIHSNDLRDLSFYETVLPYANVVVTEKYWEDRIRQAKLGAHFGTRVLRRLADLPEALAAVS